MRAWVCARGRTSARVGEWGGRAHLVPPTVTLITSERRPLGSQFQEVITRILVRSNEGRSAVRREMIRHLRDRTSTMNSCAALLGSGIWPDTILQSFRSTAPAVGYTHDFYRYPARFAPEFVRSVIAALTSPGDLVFDPFMGAGTTAVEALAAGRRFIGCDVNPLATFVAEVKTTALDSSDVSAIRKWSESLRSAINLHEPCDAEYHLAYARNLPWTLRKALDLALRTIPKLRGGKQQAFARCTLLRTGQWALDCRSNMPSVTEFFQKHLAVVEEMIEGVRQFQSAAMQRFATLRQLRNARAILTMSAEAVGTHTAISHSAPPRLIITSPPYLGVHILYHRWQVRGRRETPAPFWLAGCNDGHGASYYTFASRGRKEPVKYLDRLSTCFKAITDLMSPGTLLVQVVAFSNAEKHLPLASGRALILEHWIVRSAEPAPAFFV